MYLKNKELMIKRISSKLKQYELAKLIGMSISRLSAIENGYANIDEETLAKINRILDEKMNG